MNVAIVDPDDVDRAVVDDIDSEDIVRRRERSQRLAVGARRGAACSLVRTAVLVQERMVCGCVGVEGGVDEEIAARVEPKAEVVVNIRKPLTRGERSVQDGKPRQHAESLAGGGRVFQLELGGIDHPGVLGEPQHGRLGPAVLVAVIGRRSDHHRRRTVVHTGPLGLYYVIDGYGHVRQAPGQQDEVGLVGAAPDPGRVRAVVIGVDAGGTRVPGVGSVPPDDDRIARAVRGFVEGDVGPPDLGLRVVGPEGVGNEVPDRLGEGDGEAAVGHGRCREDDRHGQIAPVAQAGVGRACEQDAGQIGRRSLHIDHRFAVRAQGLRRVIGRDEHDLVVVGLDLGVHGQPAHHIAGGGNGNEAQISGDRERRRARHGRDGVVRPVDVDNVTGLKAVLNACREGR